MQPRLRVVIKMTDAFDYAEIVATADEILAEFGRQVKFIHSSHQPKDPTKPWRGAQAVPQGFVQGVAAVVPWMSEDDKDAVR